MKNLIAGITKGSVVAALCLTLCAAPMVGCTGSQVVNEVNVVLTEAVNILAVAQPNAPWAPQLKAAVAALQTAEATWQAGGTVVIVEDALNTIVAIMAAIPLTAAYSPLIDVLVAGIEAILAALPPSTVAPTPVVAASHNPHIGRVQIKHHMLHSRVSDFKAAWNAAVKADSRLAGAELK